MFSYPYPSRVETDSLGYRNSEERINNAQTLIVGDSVVFGYGLPTSETIPSILEFESGETVYNLAVSGWGPASYMKAVSDYSKNNSFKNLIILYTLMNDDINFWRACWPELDMCQAPKQGPVTRMDMHEFTVMAPPNFLLTSLLRHSSLVYIIFSFINESPYQIFNQQYNDDALLPDDTSVKIEDSILNRARQMRNQTAIHNKN